MLPLILILASTGHGQMDQVASDLEQRALTELRELLRSRKPLVMVHAAESLAEFGHAKEAHEAFLDEWQRNQDTPKYRTVIMRVLSRASGTESERDQWINRLRVVFCDRMQPDRLHAIECLARLGCQIPAADLPVFEEATKSEQVDISIFANWALAEAGHGQLEDVMVGYLIHADPTARYCSAYVLRHQAKVSEQTRIALTTAARAERPGTLAYVYLNSASYVVAKDSDGDEAQRCRQVLLQIAEGGSVDEVREVCGAFASRGAKDDLPLMSKLMKHVEPDIRAGAAHAIICIVRRVR